MLWFQGGTPSAGTGPSYDVSGSGYYIYIEGSDPVTFGDYAILESGLIERESHLWTTISVCRQVYPTPTYVHSLQL